MSDFIVEFRSLIGEPPAGMEWLEYVIVSLILLFLVNCCVSLISGIFNWIGGR